MVYRECKRAYLAKEPLRPQCAVALGRPLDTSDDINNPASIFSGRIFKAFVGYRKTEKPRGGKENPKYALRRKDPKDGLRVHDLLAREEL